MTTDTYQIAEYQPVSAGLAALRHRFGNRAFDLATTAGEREARAARLEMVRLRGSLEAKRKEIKAPALERSRLIDTEARAINDAILALETPIDEQIKAAEAVKEAARLAKIEAERARVAKHQRNIDDIRAAATGHGRASAAQIQLAIGAVLALDVSAARYEEFAEQAEAAKNATLADLGNLKADAEAREAEAERLRLAKIELDRKRAEQEEADRLAREKLAADQAAQAEVERKAWEARIVADALAKAERDAADLKAREERAAADRKAQAERDAQQAEMAQQAAALAEQKRVADEADRVRAEDEAQRAINATPWPDPVYPPSPSPSGVHHASGYAPHFLTAAANAAIAPTLTLALIAKRLDGIPLDEAFINLTLGIPPAAIDGYVTLYHESDWPRLCHMLSQHVRWCASREELRQAGAK